MGTCVDSHLARTKRRSSQGHDQRVAQDHDDHLLLSSPMPYESPDEESNMARELLDALRRHSQRTLLVDTASGRHWTGAQMLERATRIATGLVARCGLKPDDVVLTICDHTYEEILLVLGAILAGGAFFGSSPSDGLDEERALCELVTPQLVVAPSRLHQMVAELRHQVPGMQHCPVVWMDNPLKVEQDDNNNDNNNCDQDYYLELMKRDQVVLLSDLVASEPDEALVDDIVNRQIKGREHQLTYLLTSGSTGRPKVVPSTHLELLHGMASMVSACRSADPLLPLSTDSVIAGDLPLDHGAGINIMLLSFVLGAKFVVIRSYDVESFWLAVHEYRVTSSVASTTFAYKLLQRLHQLIERRQTDRWDLSCFKMIACCGAKMAYTELVREVQRHYTWMDVCQAYGCTEIGFISMLRLRDCRSHLDSVGHLFPGVVGRVMEPGTLRALEAEQRGELHLWARSKFQGYRCHPEVNARQLVADCHDARGFYRTGDQVHYDRDERLHVHGRFKDTLFLAEDWKILPAELEQLVDQHPLVAQSAVVGVPDPELPGCDAPRAFVRLIEPAEAATLEDEQLRLGHQDLDSVAQHISQFVAERTAAPKHLRGGVHILRQFPTVGLLNKVDRKALRQMS